MILEGRDRTLFLQQTMELLFFTEETLQTAESHLVIFQRKKKRKGSRMENLEEELNSIMEALSIPFEKPKRRYRTDFPRPEVFPEETWKEHLDRILREGARRIVPYFQD
ncbi:hypothetical protein CEXT_448921 [Caerostris extrusa]|uniref:Uncharacterized protein n=1 Tax=Caerostris extrusa TaxID=172846 RepID=A0AAV4Y2T5_CAEEX|nr:hypothetical protein CEXT_448921 [Caerostris extrusa]